MNREWKKKAIEAIAAGDVAGLKQLQSSRKLYDFLEPYLNEDGTGSVPVEAWLNYKELPKDDTTYGKNDVLVISADDRVFILPDNGRN